MECVAQWQINPVTITFNSNGGSPVAPMTGNPGDPVTPPADPTRTGYTFSGWDPVIPATMPAANIFIYAQWTANQSTITFDSQGGTPIDPITQDEGTPVTRPADPTKDGFTFEGWVPDVPATMPVDDVTCVAQWQQNCTNPNNGGTIATDQTICSGTPPDTFTSSAAPSGHFGTLEYKWQYSTIGSSSGFSDISSSNSATYTAGTLTATTYYKRLARVTCMSDWSGAAESNVLKVSVSPLPGLIKHIVIPNGRTICYDAIQTIFVAGCENTFLVQNGGSATFIAGQNIHYLPGTKVESGGYLHGSITTTGEFCGSMHPTIPIVIAGENDNPSVPALSFFKVYPNPTDGKFTVEYVGNSKVGKIYVEIYGMKGDKLLSKEFQGERMHEFSLENRPTGIYLVRIVNEENTTMVRLIKQ